MPHSIQPGTQIAPFSAFVAEAMGDCANARSPKTRAVGRSGSIRSKLVLALALMFLVFLGINEAVSHFVIKPILVGAAQSGELVSALDSNTLQNADHIFALARRSFVLCSVSALLLMQLLLQRIVINPLDQLCQHVGQADHDSNTRLKLHDEIGEVSEAFDQLISRLGSARDELSRSAIDTGRSEVAATVIHNVGNVLTNVNSLVDTASGRVERLRIQPLHQLAERLETSVVDAEFLEATPKYLQGLAARLQHDQEDITQLLGVLDVNLRHIHDVIRDQQQYASQKNNICRVCLTSLIAEAIDCSRASLEEGGAGVTFDCRGQVWVDSDRSLLLQVLINLLANAREAMRSRPVADRRLEIEIVTTDSSAVTRIRDNGCGIAEDDLGKIFDAHFSRSENGTGLGLHFCAIAVKRCGGSITASSAGVGMGATMSVSLPIADSTTDRPDDASDEVTIAQYETKVACEA